MLVFGVLYFGWLQWPPWPPITAPFLAETWGRAPPAPQNWPVAGHHDHQCILTPHLNHETEGWNLSAHETFLAAIITRNARLRSDRCATTASSIPKPQRPAFISRISTSGHHLCPSSPSTLMEGGRFLATTALPLFETRYGRHPPFPTMSTNVLKCSFLGLLVHYLSMSILGV